jgi:hypothetical protein
MTWQGWAKNKSRFKEIREMGFCPDQRSFTQICGEISFFVFLRVLCG